MDCASSDLPIPFIKDLLNSRYNHLNDFSLPDNHGGVPGQYHISVKPFEKSWVVDIDP